MEAEYAPAARPPAGAGEAGPGRLEAGGGRGAGGERAAVKTVIIFLPSGLFYRLYARETYDHYTGEGWAE